MTFIKYLPPFLFYFCGIKLKNANKMKIENLFKGLLIITALFIGGYWTSVFLGIFPVEELVPGYRNWFMSFPLPDFYVATTAVLAVIYFKSNTKLSALFSTLTGSGLLFLGLYALAYGHNTCLLYILTSEEIIEIFIKIYCLSAGSFFIVQSWKKIKV